MSILQNLLQSSQTELSKETEKSRDLLLQNQMLSEQTRKLESLIEVLKADKENLEAKIVCETTVLECDKNSLAEQLKMSEENLMAEINEKAELRKEITLLKKHSQDEYDRNENEIKKLKKQIEVSKQKMDEESSEFFNLIAEKQILLNKLAEQKLLEKNLKVSNQHLTRRILELERKEATNGDAITLYIEKDKLHEEIKQKIECIHRKDKAIGKIFQLFILK